MTVRVAQATYLGQDLHLRVVSGQQSLMAVAQGSIARHLAVGRRNPRRDRGARRFPAAEMSDRSDVRYWVILTLPLALYLAVFLVVPFINIIVLSFYTYSPTRIWTPDLTNANYVALVDGTFATVLLRTLRLGLICTVICVVFGYPLAYFLARAERRVAMIGLFLLVTPLMVSAVIRTFGWLVILGRRGLINSTLDAVGLDRLPLLYNEAAVVAGLINVSCRSWCCR